MAGTSPPSRPNMFRRWSPQLQLPLVYVNTGGTEGQEVAVKDYKLEISILYTKKLIYGKIYSMTERNE